jgi:membrane protein
MASPVFQVLGASFKRFNDDRCFRHAVVVSYFALLCAVPLLALLAFVANKFLGDVELAIRGLHLFSQDFFAKLDPTFFGKLDAVIDNAANLGWFGLVGSLVAGSFLFSNLIYAIKVVFKTTEKKSFFYNRVLEYFIMFVTASILILSLSITLAWTAAHRAISASAFVKEYINPGFMKTIDSVVLQYLAPFALGFLVLLSLYRFIPEVRIRLRAAVVAAAVGSLLWEIFKRIFVIYVAKFTVVGVVLSKLVQGTLTSIIFFLLWITFSLAILLWGAELAVVLNERMGEKAKNLSLRTPEGAKGG